MNRLPLFTRSLPTAVLVIAVAAMTAVPVQAQRSRGSTSSQVGRSSSGSSGSAARRAPAPARSAGRSGSVSSGSSRSSSGAGRSSAPRIAVQPNRSAPPQSSGSRTGAGSTRGSSSSRGTVVTPGSSNVRGSVDRGSYSNRGNTITRGSTAARGSTLDSSRERVAGSSSRRIIGNRSTLGRSDFRPSYRSTRWDRHTWYPRYWWRPPVRIYTPTYLRVRWPRIHIHLDWPWELRYHRYWTPVYRYRQTYRIEVGVGSRRDWSNVQVETTYSHAVRYADSDRAELDIQIERIDFHDGDRYLGYVDQLPSELALMSAVVHRTGEVEFDRDIFLVGDPFVGFEVISTRAYDGWVLDDYRVEDGYRAGRVDLGRARVDPIRRSRLFEPGVPSSVVPISLLPDRDGWLWDYGVEALSSGYDDYDYYYGRGTDGSVPASALSDPLTQQDEWAFQSGQGVDLRFQRDSSIQRVR